MDQRTRSSLLSPSRPPWPPHAPYTCSKETLLAAKAMADEFGAPLPIHLSETLDEQKQIQEKYGMSPTRWLDSIGFLGPNVLADVSLTSPRVGLNPRCSGLATLAAEAMSLGRRSVFPRRGQAGGALALRTHPQPRHTPGGKCQ